MIVVNLIVDVVAIIVVIFIVDDVAVIVVILIVDVVAFVVIFLLLYSNCIKKVIAANVAAKNKGVNLYL